MKNKLLRLVFVSVATVAVFLAFCSYLISAGLTMPLDIAEGSSLLAQVFGLSGLVWIVLYCGTSDSGATTVKLIGSILVLALAFASNSAWTYALSIFIVATLVTELEFLEKLAALFTNRKEYWDWRSKQVTQAEAQKKALVDALDDESEKDSSSFEEVVGGSEVNAQSEGNSGVSPDQPVDVAKIKESEVKTAEEARRSEHSELISRGINVSKAKERARRGLKFAQSVTNALRSENSPFGNASVSENMLYQNKDESFVIDAIVKSSDVHYVVEIKYVLSNQLVNKSIWQVKALAAGYADFIRSRGVKANVQAVLVLPAESHHHPWLVRYMDVEIYFFDQKSGQFFKR